MANNHAEATDRNEGAVHNEEAQNAETPSPSLLVVSPPGLFREGIGALAEKGLSGALTIADGVDALSEARRLEPDVVLIDFALRKGDPLGIGRHMLAARETANLLFLDEFVRPGNLRQTLALGANGYWTKRDSFDSLGVALLEVAGGDPSFCPDSSKYLVQTSDGMQFRPIRGAEVAMLTEREREVLVHLAAGLDVKACGLRMGLSPYTVDNHKSSIMKKLDVHTAVDLVRLALREGLARLW